MRIVKPFQRLVLAGLLVALSACGGGADLAGTWVQVGGTRPDSVLTLNEDGTGEFQPRGGVAYHVDTWSVSGDYLTLDIPGNKVIARFELGDSLELSRVDEFEELNGRYRRR